MGARISVRNEHRKLAVSQQRAGFPIFQQVILGFAVFAAIGCANTSTTGSNPEAKNRFPRMRALEAGPPLAMAPSTFNRHKFETDSRPTFDCAERATSIEDALCADQELGKLDREVAASLRHAIRGEMVAGRSLLLSFHQQWLLNRSRECKLPTSRLGDNSLDATSMNCLRQTFKKHAQALANWSPPAIRTKTTAHPISAYVSHRLVDDRDAALCGELGKRFDELLVSHGETDPGRLTGVNEVVGTHGVGSSRDKGIVGGKNVAVELIDPGLYASYQMRAKSAVVNGRKVLDEKSLSRWIQEQKNSGGRFNSLSSQTADYAAIDVFHLRGRDFVLVNEPWAYYSPASKGEASYAGVYEILAEPTGHNVAPRCLYKLFLAPPIAGVGEQLSAYKQLGQALDGVVGGSTALLASLSPPERIERAALHTESVWTHLTLPLIAIDDAGRPGRYEALRRQHDAMLEAIFNWSERNAQTKQRYRELMPLFAPAHAELLANYQASHGLNQTEATVAADLLVMESVAYFAGLLRRESPAFQDPYSSVAQYQPRYTPAPLPGALEQSRQFANLHSAIINRAAAPIVADFVKYEFSEAGRKRPGNKRSPSGETALMAVVGQPELLQQLLVAGADPNEGNEFNLTPLMVALGAEQTSSVQQLLDAGADAAASTTAWLSAGAGWPDLETGSVTGKTVLMHAASASSAETIRLILKRNPPLAARDSSGRSACQMLDENVSLTAPERTALRPLMCRPEPSVERVTIKPLTLGELRAKGAIALGRDEVIKITSGAVIQGSNPDGKGTYELRFTPAGVIEGSSRLSRGDVIPIKGHWKVDAEGVICGSSALVIEGLAKKIMLPTLCNRFYQLGDERYSIKADATELDVARPVPKPTDAPSKASN
jgi:uncharacterized protein YecT (DUF1311 family)